MAKAFNPLREARRAMQALEEADQIARQMNVQAPIPYLYAIERAKSRLDYLLRHAEVRS